MNKIEKAKELLGDSFVIVPISTYNNDSDVILKQKQEIERYEQALKEIMKLTSCDDTWDYANRTLKGEEKTDLPYRFGSKS